MAAEGPSAVLAALAPLGLNDAQLETLDNKPAVGALLLALARPPGGSLAAAAADKTALLWEAASTLKPASAGAASTLGPYIVDGRLDVKTKVVAAVKYVNGLKGAEIDPAALEAASGVGVSVSDGDMVAAAQAFLESNKAALLEQRYAFNVKGFLGNVKKDARLRWGSLAAAKSALDVGVLELLGPETAEDKAAKKKAGKGKGKGKKGGSGSKAGGKGKGEAATVPDPEASVFAARPVADAVNSEALLAAHAAATGGTLITRFPPEPNGYLHIGHAKSMNLNFKKAFEYLGAASGATIFRYDDTNPEAESQEYIDSQAENVAWLGWQPSRVTYSSDYFEQLHAFAVQLIKDGNAFVCHQSAAEVKASREAAKVGDVARAESPWRGRSVEENLAEFERMRLGLYAEGAATLRMKIDMTSAVTTLWDPVAYRIKFVPHPRTGAAWCIYPSYDFTHCIVDSLEHVDYSLCTLEFEGRRDSYYWLLAALDLWRPHVFEFSRLNLTRNVLSKRKIISLVTSGTVRGWDDPRLLTINGLRRRGFTPRAVNAFCDAVGVTRNENLIDTYLLEHFARKDLDEHAPRAFGVLTPLKVTLTNVAPDWSETFTVPDFPKDPAAGSHVKVLGPVLWVEAGDFKAVDEKKFFGLAPGKTVGLRHAGVLTCTGVVRGAHGGVAELQATYAPRGAVKPKGNLHWVSAAPGDAPATAEVRLYSHLFTHETPDDAPGSWEDYVDPGSETVLPAALVDSHLLTAAHGAAYQLERTGYFVVDPDSDAGAGKLVLNRVVTLKESKELASVRAGGAGSGGASA